MEPKLKATEDFSEMKAPSGFRISERALNSRILIGDLASHVGHNVEIKGMVESVREFKKHSFVTITDRSGAVQIFLPKTVSEKPPSVGAFVVISGQLTQSSIAKLGYEIVAENVKIHSSSKIELPGMLDRRLDSSLDQQLDNRAITLRNKYVRAAFMCQAVVGRAFRETMEELGFVEIHSPKIVSGGTEGGAQVFKLDYFGASASLAQSPQLYKQIAVGAFERVYEIGPVFRAENSNTNRHLTEFTGLDFEMAHIQDQHDVMDVEERFIAKMLESLKNRASTELSTLGVELPEYKQFPRISWDEAVALIEKHGTHDSSTNFDREVGEAVWKEFNNKFVFVYGYPKEEKPFYIQPTPGRPGRTESFDLLFDGLEISSGGQRVHDFDLLMERMGEHGISPDDNPAYRQAFAAGMPPHGGGGMGLERVAKNILGLGNIREITLFPRDVKRVLP